MPIKKNNKQRGKGLWDAAANMALSNKHNRLMPGEKHQIIYLPSDNSYSPAAYSGPGTKLSVRIRRGDKPLSYVDKIAQGHDLRYALAQTEADVRTADNRMVQLLDKARAIKLDANFNINQASLIKAKILLEDRLGVPKSWFASYGRAGQAPNDANMYETKLKELEQQGFGSSSSGIHIKHLKRKTK
jgi:hypothetical protein